MGVSVQGVEPYLQRRGANSSWLACCWLFLRGCSVVALIALIFATPGVAATENLSIGTSWGFEEEIGEGHPNLAFVGAPEPFEAQLQVDGSHRLFLLVQHRSAGGDLCAATPAGVESVVSSLTGPEGEPVVAGSYRKSYTWTPTEPGEYVLCGYLDTASSEVPEEINFVRIVVEPSPGTISLEARPEQSDPKRMTVIAAGEAAASSILTVGVRGAEESCSSLGGSITGELLSDPAVGSQQEVGPGIFTRTYTYIAAQPGSYKICGALAGPPYYERPYALGSGSFSVDAATEETASPEHEEVTTSPLSLRNAPGLSDVRLTNRRFRVAGEHIASSARLIPLGTLFRFILTQSASVRIMVTRSVPGLQRGHSCVAATPRLRVAHAGPCRRVLVVGSIVRPEESNGTRAIVFTGRIGRTELVPGSYVAYLSASNADGQSTSVPLSFTVVH